MTKGEFVIRVYGIIRNAKNEILISDEFQMGMQMTKFPGGGLHFGEGTIDGLKREFKEECNGQEIINLEHFYTTDFYQKALFYENHQLISIYYLANLKDPVCFKISEKSFDFKEMRNGNQSFRWKHVNDLNEVEMTFPIDKLVLNKIKNKFGS
jgi:ADP-ribose pyrophosphatase YjhB (NUDIX family)